MDLLQNAICSADFKQKGLIHLAKVLKVSFHSLWVFVQCCAESGSSFIRNAFQMKIKRDFCNVKCNVPLCALFSYSLVQNTHEPNT